MIKPIQPITAICDKPKDKNRKQLVLSFKGKSKDFSKYLQDLIQK